MYKFFYRLIEEIDNDSLLIFDECMRTQNRNELTYNCAHHYCNQTQHKIIFEYFPFIDDNSNFMILLDFVNKGKYKGKGFDWEMLKGEDIQIKNNILHLEVESIDISEKQKDSYRAEKEKLFDGLGNKDPDTIPRALEVPRSDWKCWLVGHIGGAEFAIRCALKVYDNPEFVNWATKWLSGEDRSYKSAIEIAANAAAEWTAVRATEAEAAAEAASAAASEAGS